MGRLGGFGYREVARKLRDSVFSWNARDKGSHEQWRHAATRTKAVVPRHTDALPEGTLRSILKQAGIDVEDFLKA